MASVKMTSSTSFVGKAQARTTVITGAWTKVTSMAEVSSNGGRKVVEVSGQKVLVAADNGTVYAVSNKCSHLGLPLVGKTALLQGKVVDKCIVCPAHGTAYSLETGAVKGKWCPSLPEALSNPFGATPPKPLPTFPSRVTESGDIEVDV